MPHVSQQKHSWWVATSRTVVLRPFNRLETTFGAGLCFAYNADRVKRSSSDATQGDSVMMPSPDVTRNAEAYSGLTATRKSQGAQPRGTVAAVVGQEQPDGVQPHNCTKGQLA